jgi:type IV pilus assembly protein PilE
MLMNEHLWRSGRRSVMRRPLGFTLIELVITMVILAILASIAVPAYSSYILKSHRTDAKSALLDLASLEERYLSTNGSYTSTPSNLGYSAAAPPFVVGSSYYNITAITVVAAVAPTSSTSAGTPATYSITATAINAQVADKACATFTISSTGAQTATGTDPNASVDCWQ